jgi:glycosyltransferase involved in cell wall biosynthesis
LLLTSNVVCVTLRHYAHLLRQRYGVANIEHLPHGTFTEVEPLPRTRAAAAPNVLFFAHHAPHRGLEVLIEAFRIVQARFPGVTLTIAGSDHARFPGYLARVRASVNGQPGLIWLGPQPEAQVRALFAEASVVVLPYLTTTGSSSVLYRAAAYGRPVIASDLDDLRLATSEANLRVTFAPVGKAHALGQAIVRLLADPQQQCAETQHNLNALRALTLSATCARYETLLREAAHAAR